MIGGAREAALLSTIYTNYTSGHLEEEADCRGVALFTLINNEPYPLPSAMRHREAFENRCQALRVHETCTMVVKTDHFLPPKIRIVNLRIPVRK